MEGIDEIESNRHVQLQVLFQASLKDLQSNTIVEKYLAFVKMYKEMPMTTLSRFIKCIHIRWVLKNTTRCSGFYVSSEQGFHEYDVVLFQISFIVSIFFQILFRIITSLSINISCNINMCKFGTNLIENSILCFI